MRLPALRGISLADKCLLLFGGAVLLIVLVALFLPWLRMNALVSVGERLASRAEAEAWIRADPTGPDRGPDGGPVERLGILARRYSEDELAEPESLPEFVRKAAEKLAVEGRERQAGYWRGFELHFRYALVERRTEEGAIDRLVVLDRQSSAANLLAINTLYLISAGCIVLALAVLVFYLITHRLILQPVRRLKTVAERVREGDLATRAEIETGDEFEELSDTFNAMLGELQRAQERMRTTNAALDMKVSELSERNTALFEAAKVKGQFLANVSHELRTPMNSVIGFGELLLEIAHAEQAAGDDSTRLEKRVRYLDNIVSAARQLLELINGLLEMAKIEAGKTELNVDKISLAEACEGLVGLIYPLARRRGIEVKLDVSPDLPTVATDPQKLQQIVFNLLSNAVKFTGPEDASGRKGLVTLRAESLPAEGEDSSKDRVRISVIDNGPGIEPEDRERIFDAFYQLDAAHTREHPGTGLGLTICRELATLLQGEITLDSEPGRGSMFSLIIPASIDTQAAAESKLESALKGTLAGRRVWEESDSED